MERDIDRIVVGVKKQLPEIQVHQLQVTHPGDDDGVWWFSVPGVDSDVQVDSTDGQCPFLLDHPDSEIAVAAIDSVQEVVRRIVDFLSKNRARLQDVPRENCAPGLVGPSPPAGSC